jgi:hypothetical protein
MVDGMMTEWDRAYLARKPAKIYTTTIEMRGGDAEIVVEYDYYKGSPGRTYGPPELCYPSEPAHVEIIAVTCVGVTITDSLSETQLESLEQEIEEHLTERLAADEQDYWDNVRKDRRYECSEVIQEDCE